MTTSSVDISKIRLDGDTQPRVEMDPAVVTEYAAAMERGDSFPAIEVVNDGNDWWLVDGFQRLAAARSLGRPRILANMRQGTKRDAQWLSLAMNKGHGLRRSNADKASAVARALAQRPELSDMAIAEHVGVDPTTVAKHRATSGIPKSTVRTGRDGRTINTANIGKSLAPQSDPEDEATVQALFDDPQPAQPAPEPAAPDKVTDEEGNEVTGRMAEMFVRRRDLMEMCRQIADIRHRLVRSIESGDPVFSRLDKTNLISDLKHAEAVVELGAPHAVCPICDGDLCRHCEPNGWLSKQLYEAAVRQQKQVM